MRWVFLALMGAFCAYLSSEPWIVSYYWQEWTTPQALIDAVEDGVMAGGRFAQPCDPSEMEGRAHEAASKRLGAYDPDRIRLAFEGDCASRAVTYAIDYERLFDSVSVSRVSMNMNAVRTS